MKTTILYIPIGSASLPHYFNRAIILPAKYYTNRVDDLQTRFTGSIFFSETMSVMGADCFLEVVLTEDEVKRNFERFGGGYLLNTAVPISRVKTVYFLDEEQKETTVFNINAGAAYLPKRMVKIAPVLKERRLEINQPAIRLDNPELVAKANRFDILLGGLAFMRLGRKEGLNYPKDYFSTLAHFNHLIKDQVINAEKRDLVTYDDWLTGVFTSRKNTPWSEWQSLIYENVDVNFVENLALKNKTTIEKKLGVIQLDKIDQKSYIYTLSVLATYGNKTSLSINELVRLLEGPKISEDKAEELALIFGLHTRYSNLRKEYHTPVKFMLESQLDYYTIESVYQFVYNNTRDSRKFEYLDNWIPKQQPIVNENVPHFEILDTDVISKKKIQPADFFQERFGEPLKKLHGQLDDFGKNVFDNAREVVEREYSKQVQTLTAENEYLKKQNLDLIENSKPKNVKAPLNERLITPPITQPQSSQTISNDGLEDMDLKELKKIAKTKGISEAKTKLYKPTKKGLEDLINLIRNTPTLL
jgi:hypothetical protein